VEAVAQSRGGDATPEGAQVALPEDGEGELYEIGARIAWAHRTQLHEREPDEPIYRPIKIFALDPAVSRLEGGIASTKIPYEPLKPGPRGSILEVTPVDANGRRWNEADLDHPSVLVQGGYTPSMSDPRFHQQMVYAVGMLTYANFKVALGRNVAWAVEPSPDPDETTHLVLRPHGAEDANAWYDRERGEIVFGYFKARAATPVVQKDHGYVFTALSHDIIVHEMSHALLDGLRSDFLIPSHQDVLAFHEAFADLIAFFQHFTFDDFVRAAIGKSRGRLEVARAVVDIAQEFGRGLGQDGQTLRTLVDMHSEFERGPGVTVELLTYARAGREPHDLGRVLARAVVAAFLKIQQRRSRRFMKLATGGTGELPAGELATGLLDFLVEDVRSLANHFLAICIRAIDYCPPVDVRFGDYLRAVITADRDVVPDDDWAYREAIISAFGAREIYGEGCLSMTEDALAWGGPQTTIDTAFELSFGQMRFDGDPAKPMDLREARRQAGALGRLVGRAEVAEEFGLVSPADSRCKSGEYGIPRVQSVRSARRIGPDKQVVFDTVAEVVQIRRVRLEDGRRFDFYGGSTVILGPGGDVRFIIRKRVDHSDRLKEQIEFMQSSGGLRFWDRRGTQMLPARDIPRRMCSR
jgi:hypothetical protein